ncbi:uncharacterized protein [Drosophila suzukii]|uniref:Uncharacterized protein isoform X4 n=1 Tax=Drosophila suzukii TaxID=28584 RepID=A0ABM4TZU4_DROSZ
MTSRILKRERTSRILKRERTSRILKRERTSRILKRERFTSGSSSDSDSFASVDSGSGAVSTSIGVLRKVGTDNSKLNFCLTNIKLVRSRIKSFDTCDQ